MLREWGKAGAGSSFGDFGVVAIEKRLGWIVTYHHKDILTYVGPDEFDSPPDSELAIGLRGRSRRIQDAEELRVIHVEDWRSAG